MKIVFYTKLPIDECILRITKNAEKLTLLALISMFWDYEKNFFYSIKGQTIRLEKVIYYKNAYKPIFFGKLIKQNHGTKIEGHFSIHWFTKIFMTAWFGGLFFIGGHMFLAAINELFIPYKIIPGTFLVHPIIGIIIPLAFLGFGIGLIKFGKMYSKKHEKQTINFIEQILEAKIQKSS